MKIFIDTWGWLVLADKRDRRHNSIKKLIQSFIKTNYQIYTTDYVLDETITLLFRRLPFNSASMALMKIIESIKMNAITLETVTFERFNKALSLRLKLKDKPLISFTDLTSAVVADELRIAEILTEDEHFTFMGFNFHKIP